MIVIGEIAIGIGILAVLGLVGAFLYGIFFNFGWIGLAVFLILIAVAYVLGNLVTRRLT